MTLTMTGSYLEGVEIMKTIDLPSNDLGALHTTIINNTHYISIARASTDADSTVGTCGVAYVLECSEMPHCNVLQSFNTNAPVLEFFDYNNQSALLIDHKVKSENSSQEISCPEVPEIYLWSPTTRQFEPYQSVNEEVIDSEQAPLLESSSLLSRSLNQKLKKNQQNSNNGVNKTAIVRNVKTFKNPKNNERFVISSIQEGSNDYVDIMRGQSGNSNSNVGSLKKTQRIVINSKRKNFLSTGKLQDSSILSISSTRGKDMKLYRLNSETQTFEFYQQLSVAATSVKFQQVDEQSEYVLYASPETGFGLCPWLGVSGYDGCETLSSTDNTYVETITETDSGVSYVVLGQPDSLKIYRVVIEGNGTPFNGNVC